MANTAHIGRLLVLLAVAVFAGCGEKDGAAVADRPKSVFDAMTDEDRAFYANSFTTLGTVPYGRCMPESLVSILGAGRDPNAGSRFLEFVAPKRFKQNEGYSEWMRVKSVMIERKTRRVVAARGKTVSFKDEDAAQSYLDAEVRSGLNGQLFVEAAELSQEGDEWRFSCGSKYGGAFRLRVCLRKFDNGEYSLESLAESR